MQLRTPLRAHFSGVSTGLNFRNYLDMLSPHSLAQAHHGIWVWPWAPQSEAPFGMSITHAGASSFPRERPHHHIFAPFYLPFFFFFLSFSRKKKSTSGLQLLGQWKGVPWNGAGRSNIEQKLHPRPEIIFMYVSLVVALREQ